MTIALRLTNLIERDTTKNTEISTYPWQRIVVEHKTATAASDAIRATIAYAPWLAVQQICDDEP